MVEMDIAFQVRQEILVTIPKVTVIPSHDNIVNLVNKFVNDKSQPKEFLFTDIRGKITFNDLAYSISYYY